MSGVSCIVLRKTLRLWSGLTAITYCIAIVGLLMYRKMVQSWSGFTMANRLVCFHTPMWLTLYGQPVLFFCQMVFKWSGCTRGSYIVITICHPSLFHQTVCNGFDMDCCIGRKGLLSLSQLFQTINFYGLTSKDSHVHRLHCMTLFKMHNCNSVMVYIRRPPASVLIRLV